jgi:hypothetical protein
MHHEGKKPRRLTRLKLHEVSCVDTPANQGARVLLFKHVEGSPGGVGATGGAPAGEGGNPSASAEPPVNKEKAMTTKTEGDAVNKADVERMIAEAVAKATGDLTAKATAAEAEVAKVRAAAEAAQAEAVAANKRAEDAEKSAAVERERRELADLAKRADETLGHLPGTAAEKAIALRALVDVSEEARKTVEAMLIAGQSAMKASMAGEIGKGGRPPSGTGAEAELNAKAGEIATAEKCSLAKAYDLATQRHPELYSRYRAEQAARAAA